MSPKTKDFFAAFGGNIGLGAVMILFYGVAIAIVFGIVALFSIGLWVWGIIAILVVLLGLAALKAWTEI